MEACDGLDNDCIAATPDGYADDRVGRYCSVAMRAGRTTCDAGEPTCQTPVAVTAGTLFLPSPAGSSSSGESIAYDVAVAPDGQILVAGTFTGDLDFGGGPRTSVGGWDGFVASFLADGSPLWDHVYGGPGDDWARTVATDRMGGIHVVGQFTGEVDFGRGTRSSRGGIDAFVVSYDVAGIPTADFTVGGETDDVGFALAAYPDGDLLFGGGFTGGIEIDGMSIASVGEQDGLVLRLDRARMIAAHRVLSSARFEHVTGLAVDGSGNAYVTGTSEATQLEVGATAPITGSFYLVSYDPSLDHRWHQALGGARGWGVDVDDADSLVVAVGVHLGGDYGGGARPHAGDEDILVASFDTLGNYVWDFTAGTRTSDIAYGIDISAAGAVLVGGVYSDGIDFGTGPRAGSSSTGSGGFLLGLDASGALVSDQTFPCTRTSLWATAHTLAGDALGAGAFQGTCDFGDGEREAPAGWLLFVAAHEG
jgi:hypothetical protein